MKYTQFLEFNQLLEANKADIDSWKTSDIQLVKEAEGPGSETNLSGGEQKKDTEEKSGDEKDKLDVEKPLKGTGWMTKKGRLRKSLNKQAQKLMDGINKNVADKFLKPIKDLKIKVYQKMAEVGKGKQPKEIVKALQVDLGNIKKIQEKQMAQIEKYAQNVIDNNTKKIHSAIEKKGLKETNAADLQSYWSLLCTQIMNNLYQKMGEQDDRVIEEVIKDEGILKAAKQINAALNKGNRNKLSELQKEIEKLKGEIKSKDAEEKKSKEGETSSEPEKTETK